LGLAVQKRREILRPVARQDGEVALDETMGEPGGVAGKTAGPAGHAHVEAGPQLACARRPLAIDRLHVRFPFSNVSSPDERSDIRERSHRWVRMSLRSCGLLTRLSGDDSFQRITSTTRCPMVIRVRNE
jgi:hypothetical protein